jgi:hypothetical protein
VLQSFCMGEAPKSPTRIIGIDPGLNITGYGIVACAGTEVKLLAGSADVPFLGDVCASPCRDDDGRVHRDKQRRDVCATQRIGLRDVRDHRGRTKDY